MQSGNSGGWRVSFGKFPVNQIITLTQACTLHTCSCLVRCVPPIQHTCMIGDSHQLSSTICTSQLSREGSQVVCPIRLCYLSG